MTQDEDAITPLHDSCAGGELRMVIFLTEEIEKYNPPMKDILADLKDMFGNNPLHYAAKCGHLNIVQFFNSEKKCSPNIPGQYGRTPLHRAAEKGHLHLVKYLIDGQSCDPSCMVETNLHHVIMLQALDI